MSDAVLDDHILIIGAGIIGLTCAWRLARDGHRVFIIEARSPGAGATGVAGGMLGLTAEVQYGEDDLLELQRRSRKIYPDFLEGLRRESGIDCRYNNEPTLVVARDRDDVEALERTLDYQKRVGLDARWADDSEVRNRAPALRNIRRAVICPDDHRVDPRRLVDALTTALDKRDVELLEDAPVDAIIHRDGRAAGVRLEDGRRFFADKTIVCAGTWSGRIDGIPEFERPVLRPVRGQVLTLGDGPGPSIECVVRSPDVYLVPRRDGRLVIGSTMEEKGFDSDVTAGAARRLLDEAWQIMPGIDERLLARFESGFRPITLDDRPLLGMSALPGLYLATGHGRHGILLAPVTGHILANQLWASRPAANTDASFDPRRFSR